FPVGLGACGIYHPNSEYTVALNSAQLSAAGGGYPNSLCGSQISITYNGKTTQATIQDECPTCPWGGLDLSMDLFTFFADHSVGV
ncbi:RlpA-like double-psi beta-barrel-protein domain-containing protein-containing protein, partial [Mrakia frigida]|uniref:RlpA-like double-psi beta-barrel domain-containing protein n=1 Tax=Mrakia frigida TaxID=29902 RepID=UPI003FCC208D